MTQTDKHIKEAEDKGHHIEAGFRGLFANAYPAGVSEERHADLRKFFFAGATFLFHRLLEQIDHEHDPTENDMAFMERVSKEIGDFYESLPNCASE